MFSGISLIIGAVFLGLLRSSESYDNIVIMVIVLFTITFVIDIHNSNAYRKYCSALVVALLVRIVCLLYDVYTRNPLNLPEIGGELKSDPLGFYTNALLFAEKGYNYYGGFFPKVMGIIFRITGSSRLWGEFIVILFSIATILITIKILEELGINRKTAVRGIFILGILPYYAFLSVVFRRESLITLLLSCSLLCFIKWVLNKGSKHFIFGMAFALACSLFHGGTGLIVVTYIVALLMYSPKEKSFKLEAKNLVITIAMIIIMAFIFVKYGSLFFNKLEKVTDISSVASLSNEGGSSYAAYVGNSNTIGNFIVYSIPRYLYFLFSPFPWQWRGFGDIISFVFNSSLYLFTIFITLRTIIRLDKKNGYRKLLVILLMISIGVAFVFSWGTTNTGTAIRHRDKIVTLYIVMMAVCYHTKWMKKDILNEIEGNIFENVLLIDKC